MKEVTDESSLIVPLKTSHFVPNGTVCKWKENCADEGLCCNNCENNTGKKSHYEPKPQEPYFPGHNPVIMYGVMRRTIK